MNRALLSLVAFTTLAWAGTAPAADPTARLAELEADAFSGMDLEIQGKKAHIDSAGWFVNQCDSWPMSEGLGVIRVEGRYGYIAKTGKVAMRPRFDLAGRFSEGLARVALETDSRRAGFVKLDGQLAFTLEKNDVPMGDYSEGLVPVTRVRTTSSYYGTYEMKFGFMDRSGRWVTEPIYEGARPFHEGLAAVQSGGLWGYIDKKGKLAIAPAFRNAMNFQEGFAVVTSSTGFQYGFVNAKGEVPSGLRYSNAADFNEGLARVQSEDPAGRRSWSFVNPRFETVIPGPYEDAGDFSGGLAPVKTGGRWGFIDKTGKLVLPARWVDAHVFSEGLAPVKAKGDGFWGYIDTQGKLVIPHQFGAAKSFSEGVAAVSTEKNFGYIDRTGHFVFKGAMCGEYFRMTN